MEYAYDYSGEIISRANREGVTLEQSDLLIDENNPTGYSQILGERDRVSGEFVRTYVFGREAISQWSEDGNDTNYFLTDALGSTRLLVDRNANPVSDSHYSYSPFGELLDAPEQLPTNLAFTGQWLEPLTDLQYHRARWLDPSASNWLSPDPVYDFPANFGNAYTYCGGDPVNTTDVSGESSFGEILVTCAIRAVLRGIVAIPLAGLVGVVGGGLSALDTLIATNGAATTDDLFKAFSNGFMFGLFVTELLAIAPIAAFAVLPMVTIMLAQAAGEASGSGDKALTRYRLALLAAAIVGGSYGVGRMVTRARVSKGLLELSERSTPRYSAQNSLRAKIQAIYEEPAVQARLAKAAQKGEYIESRYGGHQGSTTHHNVVVEFCRILEERTVFKANSIKIGGKQRYAGGTMVELRTGYKMPDLSGDSIGANLRININFNYRHAWTTEQANLKAIIATDPNSVNLLFDLKTIGIE